MAGKSKPISVVISGEYTDRDIKRAISDLKSLQTEAPAASKGFGSLGDTLTKLGGVMAATFTVTAVVDFLRDSMQAAMEDEKSMVALATAMENVGLASRNAASEELIRAMSMQYGIADDLLRPSFQKLVTVTKDVEGAQRLLRTALDLSSAGYGDLESTTKALSAAANGNFTALQRLKVPIDANIIAAKDFDGAITALNAVVGGQAAAAAETYQGKMNRVTVAVGEAKEVIGYALLEAVDNAAEAFGGTDGLTNAIAGTGDALAKMVSPLTTVTSLMGRFSDIDLPGISSNVEVLGTTFDFLNLQMLESAPLIGNVIRLFKLLGLADDALAANDAAKAATQTQQALEIYDTTADGAIVTSKGLVGSFDAAADAAADAAGSVLGLSTALDVYSKVGYTPGGTLIKGMYDSGYEAPGMPGADAFQRSMDLAKRAAAAVAAARRGSSGSSGGSSRNTEDAAEKKAREAAQKAADALKQRMQQLKSYAEETGRAVTGFLSIDAAFTAFSDRQKAASDAYANLIEAQKQLGEDATQAEKDRVAELQKVYDSAKDAAARGAQDIVGEFVARAEQAKQFGEKLKVLLANGLNKQTFDEIAGMSADRGIQVANAFIDGNMRQNIDRVNDAVGSAKAVADQVGVQAATTFKDVGEGLAKGMMAALAAILDPKSKQTKALRSMMDDFAKSLNRVATIDVITRRYELGQTPPDVPSSGIDWAGQVAAAAGMNDSSAISDADFNAAFDRLNEWANGTWTPMAAGGIVTGPTPIIAGEAGPEAIIPLSRAGGMLSGGNTYSITVQAGIGDPRAIGQSVVEAITRFERANGPVYAKAT